MNEGLSIRRARAEDGPRLGVLGAQLVVEHYEFDRLRFLAPTDDTPERYGAFLASQIDRPDRLVLVAERDGVIAAYTFAGLEGADFMTLRGPAGVIYDLIVDAEFRRQGIGKALLEAVFADFAERGIPRVLLSTAEKNHEAHKLFEAAGFRRTMIEMTRELGAADR